MPELLPSISELPTVEETWKRLSWLKKILVKMELEQSVGFFQQVHDKEEYFIFKCPCGKMHISYRSGKGYLRCTKKSQNF
jgi:hypothetical protein